MTCALEHPLSATYNLQGMGFYPLNPVRSVRIVNFGGGDLAESPTARER